MLLKYCYLSTAFYSFQHVHQLIRWMRTLWWSDTFNWYVKEWCQINPTYCLTGLLVILIIIWVFCDLTHSFFFVFLKTCFCCLACFGYVCCGTGWICFVNELLWSRTNLPVTCTNACMVQKSEWLLVHLLLGWLFVFWDWLAVHSALLGIG